MSREFPEGMKSTIYANAVNPAARLGAKNLFPVSQVELSRLSLRVLGAIKKHLSPVAKDLRGV